MVRPVAIASVAIDISLGDQHTTSIERVFDVAHRAVLESGLDRTRIGLTVSASSDMLEGRPFNFVKGLEALGTWPATHVRHVEMDGAWGAYEAWVSLQSGEFDSALIVAWGCSTEASLHHVFNSQLDPFTLAPLGLDHLSSAGLQLDAWNARTGNTLDLVPPRHYGDGACAIVLAAQDALSKSSARVWIRGADHRSETGSLGHRDLSQLTSARLAFDRATELAGWSDPDYAELHAPFEHQEQMLLRSFGLNDVELNPSSSMEVPMAGGLMHLANAARSTKRKTLAHATSGHAMQQNMVWLLERA
ncbi:MAG: lipid-transfer protein [Actinomycetota bacterium]